MFELATADWILLGAGALLVGFSKTAIPGLAMIPVAMFATILPARTSTAALLLLLLVGDLFAIVAYRRSVDWTTLRHLLPAVLIGILSGAIFMKLTDDLAMKRVIGVILLALIALTLWQRYGTRAAPRTGGASVARAGFGALGGFTTMTANAGGPVMSLYFLSMGFDVKRFLGTSAWFFFTVNLIKLPFSVGIGLLDQQVLVSMAALAPIAVVGALVGRWVASRMTSAVFDPIVWVLTIVGAVALLF